MESFNSKLKDEAMDLFLEAKHIWELKRIVKVRIEYYNEERRHSMLGRWPVNLSQTGEDSRGGTKVLAKISA